jgi:excisionase family DNA binding protein
MRSRDGEVGRSEKCSASGPTCGRSRDYGDALPRWAFAGEWQGVCLFSEWNGGFVERVAVEGASVSADELADGNAVTILASDVALSPGEAADLLGLSRPFVVRLLDDGLIPSQTQPQTRHRKVLLSDVIAVQAQRARKRAGRQRIMKIVEGNDLPY